MGSACFTGDLSGLGRAPEPSPAIGTASAADRSVGDAGFALDLVHVEVACLLDQVGEQGAQFGGAQRFVQQGETGLADAQDGVGCSIAGDQDGRTDDLGGYQATLASQTSGSGTLRFTFADGQTLTGFFPRGDTFTLANCGGVLKWAGPHTGCSFEYMGASN